MEDILAEIDKHEEEHYDEKSHEFEISKFLIDDEETTPNKPSLLST